MQNLVTVVYDLICKFSESETISISILPNLLLLIQLFRTLYKEHGTMLTLEIDLLVDTIIKILTMNFDAHCNDKNLLREALIVEIIGIIHSINTHNIETFKDE